MRVRHSLAALLPMACAGACSLAVDATDIDEGCRDGEKVCDDKCVLISDPAYGCSVDDCTRYCAYDHAIPKCEDFQCAIDTCLEGYCGDGCEINMLADEKNCGACGNECAAETQTCRNGECVPR